ncbi:MAG TPA: hypothetical protein VFB63_19610 [Bryobacteraceae bacterium]|nr:hypothetical protein [Bryobacteraceae bacterium]
MRKMIFAMAVLAAAPAFAGSAFWTGNVRYVTTVSYQQGVNCEYNYNGQLFWRTFVGSSCPSTVEVY